jgi:hypothetical protein
MKAGLGGYRGRIDPLLSGAQQRRPPPDGIGPRFFFTDKLMAAQIIRQTASVHIPIRTELGHQRYLWFCFLLETGGFISAASSRAMISTG